MQEHDAPAFASSVEVVSRSGAMQTVLEAAGRAAKSTAKVLITGETGVGKGLIARYIHRQSARAQGPMISVNCAGIAEGLLESELFGHARGSFTGAYRDRTGLVKQAHGGTLFLDEVGEMSARMQGLLLRFLETGEVHPVGADRPSAPVDVRIIAATHRDLRQMSAAGTFRTDLLYRLRVLEIHIPALRERPEDVAALLEHHLARCSSAGRRFTPAALRYLREHSWPGNVRELQNVVECLTAMYDGVIDVGDVLPVILTTPQEIAREVERLSPVDALYNRLVNGKANFWKDVYEAFKKRDLTRDDLRSLVCSGLAASNGNYRQLMHLFGVPPNEYKRFLNFLTAHNCQVDFRVFRGAPLRAPTTP